MKGLAPNMNLEMSYAPFMTSHFLSNSEQVRKTISTTTKLQ